MSPLEIHCALLLGVNHYFQRTEWQQEREQLLSKLEERKWVDQAKRILCEIKGISEAEAYDFFRKQAMNERKRMVDVATSIVKVYQILQGSKQRRPQTMISLLKEVGRGKRGARDLTYEEASQAAELILTGAATQAQMGAFLVAERIKMESPDEIKAFIHALRQRIRPIQCLAAWIVPDLMMDAPARLSQPYRPHSFSRPADSHYAARQPEHAAQMGHHLV